MRAYIVRVDPPIVNLSTPGEPRPPWHWAVEAKSAAEAVAKIQNSSDCYVMRARVVPSLG
jgi:hypothetical protein